MVEKPKVLLTVFVCYAIGLIPVMYFTIKHHAHYDFDPRVVFDICAPYFSDHTIYGACLAFIIPLLIILLKSWPSYSKMDILRWPFALLVIIIITSLFLALSRAAILSVIFAGVFAVLLHFRIQFKALIATLGVVIISIALSWNSIYSTLEQNESVSNDGEIVNHFSSVSNVSSDASNLERINRWVCAVHMFQAKPLVGFGPGTYQFEYNQFQTSQTKTYISTNAGDRGNAHSEYLTHLSENGIFGFVLFIVLVFTTIYFGMQNHYQLPRGVLKMVNLGVLLGLTTFFFHGIFNMFNDQIKMASLVYTSLGVIVWINMRHKKENIRVEKN
jgi:O-antigen ligase